MCDRSPYGTMSRTTYDDDCVSPAPHLARPGRVYEMTADQVYDEVNWSAEDILEAIGKILPSEGGDSDVGYLDKLVADDPKYSKRTPSMESRNSSSRRLKGHGCDDVLPKPPKRSVIRSEGCGTLGCMFSPPDMYTRARRKSFSNSQLPSAWKNCYTSPSIGYTPQDDYADMYKDVSDNIAPYVRQPRRLNTYFTFLAVVKTVLPFGILIPILIISVFLLSFTYSGVKVCGVPLCSCSSSEVALFILTFGLMQDMPCAMLFSAITTACITHMRDAETTTLNRASMLKELDHVSVRTPICRTDRDLFCGLSLRTASICSSAGGGEHSRTGSISTVKQAFPHTNGSSTLYGPYILKPMYIYLKHHMTWIVAILCLLLAIIVRWIGAQFSINPSLLIVLIGVAKCLPIIIYACIGRCPRAAIPSCITILLPLCYAILITNVNNTRASYYFTIIWPMFGAIVEWVVLQILTVTLHPTVSNGVRIAITSCIGFFSQILTLGIGFSISLELSPIIMAFYVIQFFIFEFLLNTILLTRFGGWLYRLCCRCGGNKSKNYEAVGFNGVPAYIGLTSLGNIAALTRLPSLIMSLVFLIPVIHFQRWPFVVPGIMCDGSKIYKCNWWSLGILLSVSIVVIVITVITRKLRTASLVPLYIYGAGWCMLLSIYCISILPFSMTFIPNLN
eukprot:Tbor_TRINITY_DN5282_c2_g5::TRINITY_DN5282_c2_g5_i1::g.16568::m.16568